MGGSEGENMRGKCQLDVRVLYMCKVENISNGQKVVGLLCVVTYY